MTELTAAVAEAIAAVRVHFAGKPVEVVPDGGGGAFVTVENIEVGLLYTPSTTWLGFHINAAYPTSDVYPHFVGPLSRTDGSALGDAITSAAWRGRPGLQLSRKSNRWNPHIDNAANKAERTLRWLADR
jgi:hypothetical protein